MKAHSKNARREVREVAARYGFQLQRVTASGHLQFIDARGRVAIAGAGSDPRAIRNIEAQFRRLAKP